jgi:hypothetical protein
VNERNLDLQLDAAGVERILSDKESDAKADRKGLAETLSLLSCLPAPEQGKVITHPVITQARNRHR